MRFKLVKLVKYFPRDSSISNLADTISSLEKQVAQMTSEKDDLLVKIEAGEGANTALTQLKQVNEGLAEKLQSANQESKRLSEEMASKVDSLRGELAETQSAASQATDKG